MNTLSTLVGIIWAFRIIANLLTYAQLWYVKEYRFDRMRIHLGTGQGKRIFFPAFRRPRISPKSILLILGSCLLLQEIFWLLPSSPLLALLVVDALSFPVTAVVVGLLSLPTGVFHTMRISRAARLLRSHAPMRVIGITGSFGKTSTKEFIGSILATKFQTLKTEASKNSPIGIAELVLKRLTPDTEVFVVEMGAYKKGEIAQMSDMVRPSVGIITAINPQHQDLFGSIDATKKAKYELIEGLVGDKIAIFNLDNAHTREMAGWAIRGGQNVWGYSTNGTTLVGVKKLFQAAGTKGSETGLSFAVTSDREKHLVKTQILGEHFVGNILAAIAGAVAAGMPLKQACAGAASLQPVGKTLHKTQSSSGVALIDDTFNNNPDAAIAALKFIEKAKGKKFLVFQPMIELGQYAESSHEAVGAAAGTICDAIVLTNDNFLDSFVKGVRSTGAQTQVVVLTPVAACSFLQKHAKAGDTILFKGKEADHVLRKMKGTSS